jgi:nitrite reductase/ring-hydroxylating ferredoxin subunit
MKQKSFPLVLYILIPVAIFLFCYGCKKEDTTTQPDIPQVAVNIVINPNSTMYLNLNAVGGWEYLTGGYKGILVYRLSTDQFMAFERTCPYDPAVLDARINVDTSGITCYCPVCKSKFIIIDGTPYEGPSKWPLKQYQTNYDGQYLYIFN